MRKMRRLVKALHAAGYETGEVDVDFNWVSWNDGVTNEKHIAEDLAAVSLDTIPAVRGLLYVIGLTSTTYQYHPHPHCPPVTSLLCGFVLSLFLCRYGTLGDALAYMGDFSETMKQRCLDSLNYKYHVFKQNGELTNLQVFCVYSHTVATVEYSLQHDTFHQTASFSEVSFGASAQLPVN